MAVDSIQRFGDFQYDSTLHPPFEQVVRFLVLASLLAQHYQPPVAVMDCIWSRIWLVTTEPPLPRTLNGPTSKGSCILCWSTIVLLKVRIMIIIWKRLTLFSLACNCGWFEAIFRGCLFPVDHHWLDTEISCSVEGTGTLCGGLWGHRGDRLFQASGAEILFQRIIAAFNPPTATINVWCRRHFGFTSSKVVAHGVKLAISVSIYCQK